VGLHDLNEFFKLSAALNYQLSARVVGRNGILATIVAGRQLAENERGILLAVLEYLELAYHEKYRRLGPKAVLHPLRASALLVRAQGEVLLLDLLTELLHDKFEDIVAEDFEPEEWRQLEDHFNSLLKRVDPRSEWFLMERLETLTRRPKGETYYQYIGRLLTRASTTPELVRVKLADRLDNTLDMRVDFRDPLDDVTSSPTSSSSCSRAATRAFRPTCRTPRGRPSMAPAGSTTCSRARWFCPSCDRREPRPTTARRVSSSRPSPSPGCRRHSGS